MLHTTTRRRLRAGLVALLVAPALAACSFSVGEIEPVGGDSDSVEEPVESTDDAQPEGTDATPEGDAAPETAGEPAEPTTLTAEHISVRVPSDWSDVGDADGWSYVHQKLNAEGGVAGRIGFMPGGAEMTAQEAVDWFISQVEGQGVTDENYAPVTTLRDEDGRANTSYTYQSDGQQYVGVVWALVDGNGIPSLVQLSGANEVITQDFVADVDRSLNLVGDWQGTAG